VQDNYVVQWGDPTEKKPLPPGVADSPPAEYERSAAGLTVAPHPYRDTFAGATGFVAGWPVAEEDGQAWLTHCYGMVGVGRGNAPSTGSGAELYAIIGHAPRQLDRNIALVGRVLTGIESMAALPRGSEAMGFYKTEAERVVIVKARLASELPEAERPKVRLLDTASTTFAAWVKIRANRKDDFYVRPAGAIDLCGVMPPVKEGD
jgi:peptidylprolyl isomerase